jgi:hypothetical protein
MRRVVMMIIDGLRADSVRPEWMPALAAYAARSHVFGAHRGVFPSATRVSSATIATGCYPERHGLAGNAVAWWTNGGFDAVSVGSADFVERWRAQAGHTLQVPTLADRLGEDMLIVSNSSPGAAHMQDPNRLARFFHRSGSWRPGGAPVPAEEALNVAYDSTGDAVTTARFCEALLHAAPAACSLLWICEPDHTQHTIVLGSPDHRALLAGSDRMVAQVIDAVERARAAGDDVLLLIGSDHGHETTDEVIDVSAALVAGGFKAALDSREMVVASSGMGGLIYADYAGATDGLEAAGAAKLGTWLRAQPWCHDAWTGNALAQVRLRAADGLTGAFALARRDDVNEFGVRGYAHVIKDQFSPNDASGNGQHGGFGPYEGAPLLLANGAGLAPGTSTQATALVDIAPTIAAHLQLPHANYDGVSLL